MENISYLIKENKLINKGDIIGVGCSGGSDSVALLHYLTNLSQILDFEVVAIHVDHSIRENSFRDANYVMQLCSELGIRGYKFKIDVPKLAQQKKSSLETVARDARYEVFEALVKKGVVDKIAIAHNSRDQAETILLNLFRGTGVSGASGMELVRDGIYIRPMLNTPKENILKYIQENDLTYLEDETNKDTTYSRNYVRNVILPLIDKRWPDAVNKIVNFGHDCADDNKYINKQVYLDAVIFGEKTAKIPSSYFVYPEAIVSRIIFQTLKKIGVTKDIERIHIKMIKNLAIKGENGKKIRLPMSLTVHKEYDYITIANKQKEIIELNQPFKSGSFEVENFGTITVKRVKEFDCKPGELLIDAKKLPKDASWRFRKNGDVFEKFGGGTKKLKDYLIDRKVPNRIRSTIPVLASGNNIYVIAGVEISNSVKLDNNATTAVKITIS